MSRIRIWIKDIELSWSYMTYQHVCDPYDNNCVCLWWIHAWLSELTNKVVEDHIWEVCKYIAFFRYFVGILKFTKIDTNFAHRILSNHKYIFFQTKNNKSVYRILYRTHYRFVLLQFYGNCIVLYAFRNKQFNGVLVI